ncbi:cytidylate kinase family protein [Candidatus Woesearchaeota archaeon]|nr:cytidylate kinase family protein [Candidatus Woesearchaeota archaeon]
MIITISGKNGSGKSTIAKELAKSLGLKHKSSGDFFRDLAKEKGLSFDELGKLADKDPKIDNEIDNKQKRFGEIENNFVMDGRLSFFFIPHSFKIFLDVSDRVAAERIFKEGRSEEHYLSLKDAEYKLRERNDSLRKRFLSKYNVDYCDFKNYDLVIDTTKMPIKVIKDKILRTLGK